MSGSITYSRHPLIGLLRGMVASPSDLGWIFLPSSPVTAQTEVLFVTDIDDTEAGPELAKSLGFPRESLGTDQVVDIFEGLKHLTQHPLDDEFVEAFFYYTDYDAFLPEFGYVPPPLEESQARLDREFCDILGEELGPSTCRKDGCERLRISQSAFCKKHHFEMIQQKPYPFG